MHSSMFDKASLFLFAGQKVCWCTTARPAPSIPSTGVKSVRTIPIGFSTSTAVNYISMLEDTIPYVRYTRDRFTLASSITACDVLYKYQPNSRSDLGSVSQLTWLTERPQESIVCTRKKSVVNGSPFTPSEPGWWGKMLEAPLWFLAVVRNTLLAHFNFGWILKCSRNYHWG